MTDRTKDESYQLAALDQEFILGDSMRGARFMMEYAKAEEHMRARRIRSTIVVFGSARILEDGGDWQAKTYNAARTFARIASERGGALADREPWHDNVIVTGGGPGIMEAANRGAQDAGAMSIGLNIAIPHEQAPNPYITPELSFKFHYFAMRKMHFAMRARALVIFPGGFGTLDELFELLTISQTGKAPAIPIVLYDRAFWTRIIHFEALAETGMISPADLGLFDIVDDAEEAWERLTARGLLVGTGAG
ncbi:MAG: TIGR00730 family Rossman fold protein [Hyphomonas sp.]|uniref:LOG family protein n=1 Tax=Hyphomonas sp. TaxID=87 RepID=UPI0025BD57FC|nr:TIGR00730 family Rossman fold protein [Hyphomonas sp.]MBA4337416.1 TIGR00730 family Rossman fold protein [Hyphomonas sp.]